MPQINQEKTKELQQRQEESIDKILSDATQNNINIYKEIIKKTLEDRGHAKYRTMLNLLRRARLKIKEKDDFIVNTMFAMNSLEQQGLSKKTIKKLITLLFDKNLHYYKSSEKIKAIKHVDLGENDWTNIQNVDENIKAGYGGECQALTVHLADILETTDICRSIESETNKACSIKLSYGSSREYFKEGAGNHVFITMKIGDKNYILDPSFGEIALATRSGYMIRGNEEKMNYEDHNHNKLNDLIINFSQGKLLTTDFSDGMIPIGFLDGTELFLSIGYANYKEIRDIELFNKEDIQPIIMLVNKNGLADIHWFDQLGNHKYTTATNYTKHEKHLAKKTLLSLYPLAGLNSPIAVTKK